MGAALLALPLGKDGAMATLESATPGDYSHQEYAGSCRDGRVPLPWKGMPKTRDEVCMH